MFRVLVAEGERKMLRGLERGVREPGHALTNVIDVFVTLLRRKVERPGRPPLIHTVRGLGYSLREPPCP
jgi:DNA-binding winged helix-turn-helix (wHTH) protein